MPPDQLRQAIAERALARELPADAQALSEAVVAAGGGAVQAVVFFGSRKTRARPDANSAYDLFVVVGDYTSFYRSLAASGALGRPAGLLAAINRVLPPNQISFVDRGAAEPYRAKCAVISLVQLQRETSRARHDHFCLGRLFQPVAVLYCADALVREQVLSLLESAHRLTFEWARPWLPARFDAAAYVRALLRTSFRGEVRPEPAGRTEALYQAQADYHAAVYGRLLHELAAAGELAEPADGAGYALARPVRWPERLALSLYFKRSLLRATLRWGKHIVSFEGWLDFIVSKAERHSGQQIVLTPRERRYPVIFLWPRVWRFLRHKNR